MTHLLWKYYWENDIDNFCAQLTSVAFGCSSDLIGGGSSSGHTLGTSPCGGPGNHQPRKVLGKVEVNRRDYAGLPLLLRAASSTAMNALSFVEALLEHPDINIYVQDVESGWNALHRALYHGNISIARTLLQKERQKLMCPTASVNRIGQLIKTKDHEGNSPFELYNATIRVWVPRTFLGLETAVFADDWWHVNVDDPLGGRRNTAKNPIPADSQLWNVDFDTQLRFVHDKSHGLTSDTMEFSSVGNELFAFGSNKNMSLGFGDQDDRHFPERVSLKRPDSLVRSLWNGKQDADVSQIPTLGMHRPLLMEDVILSKLHSVIITADPISNLYVCGIGAGGRLGLGHEDPRFNYTPVQGSLTDKKVVQAALGQDHSMAVTDNGELWTWGTNEHSQLGYSTPQPKNKHEKPKRTTPGQVFGLLKRERVVGVAASSIHSVAHTGSSLFCWGRNVGQLGLMDADSRSLHVQPIPRKVAPSIISGNTILIVSAMDAATTFLLGNHAVYVLTAYGYVKLSFAVPDPLSKPVRKSVWAERDHQRRTQIEYVTCGGKGTIAAVSAQGDLFTVNLDSRISLDLATASTADHAFEARATDSTAASTLNSWRIKGGVSQPQCIWMAWKDGVRSVSVGENGSVILSTRSGAAWQRVRRSRAKDVANVGSSTGAKRKDFKFQRIPYVTNVTAVSASAFGAFALIRKDASQAMGRTLCLGAPSLQTDLAALNPLGSFQALPKASRADPDKPRHWPSRSFRFDRDLERDLRAHISAWHNNNGLLDVSVCTTSEPGIEIPVHGWLLSGRSAFICHALTSSRKQGSHEEVDTLMAITSGDGRTLVTFLGIDIITLLNLVLFVYEDGLAWQVDQDGANLPMLQRFRQSRTELIKLATRLNMAHLEVAARTQEQPSACMAGDLEQAMDRPGFFQDSDIILELDGGVVMAHSLLLRLRSPWFERLYRGRAQGGWLTSRRTVLEPGEKMRIDLTHIGLDVFSYVMRYLYADVGTELFDAHVGDSLDRLINLVLDVAEVADFLMLDRLAEICQKVLWRLVNSRNLGSLMNATASFVVTKFKETGLRYMTVQLENQLENHLLDDVDKHLMGELDANVRHKQGRQLRLVGDVATQGESYNEILADDIAEERQRRVKAMAFKPPNKVRRGQKMADEKGGRDGNSGHTSRPELAEILSEPARKSWQGGEASPRGNGRPHGGDMGKTGIQPETGRPGKPWVSVTLCPGKICDILSTAAPQTSALSDALAAQTKYAMQRPKLSQKARKKQQAEKALLLSAPEKQPTPAASEQPAGAEAPPAAWKLVSKRQPKTPIRHLLGEQSHGLTFQKPLVAAEVAAPSLPVRPTELVAGSKSWPMTTSPAPSSCLNRAPLKPHSVSYKPAVPKPQAQLGQSMVDIMAQEHQERAAVKDAVAKRSLADIQQEQAFLDWFDAESRKTQMADEAKKARDLRAARKGKKRA